MDPSRFVLTDRQWRVIEPLCPGGLTAPGRTGFDTRLFLEAVLWIVQTDAPWRDLFARQAILQTKSAERRPREFGNWNSTFRRFRRWVQADVFKRIFDAFSDDPDMEYAMIPSRQITARSPAGQRPQRLHPLEIDEEMYKWRHLIENYFQKLKDFKRIAMRSDKTDTSYAAMVSLGSAIINSR